MRTIEYNYTTEMILEWGRMAIQDTDADDYLAEIEESIFAADTLVDDVRSDLDQILAGVREAVATLQQEEIMGATPDDDFWNDASDAFDMLDVLVYLMQGMDRLISRHNAQLANEILTRLEPAYESVSELFLSSDFSGLRLAAFNEQRRDSLTGIKQAYHYLFPWHLLQNEEPVSILTILTDHYADLTRPEKLPETLSDNLALYISEIQKDGVLSGHLQKEHLISQSIRDTLSSHWAYRLWRVAQSEGYKRLLPEKVETEGIGLVSRAVLKQKGISAQDRFALAVAAACYAPGIEDTDRIRLLLQYEEKLNADWRQYDAKTASGQMIKKLHLLGIGKGTAKEAAVDALNFWFQILESANNVSIKSEESMFDLVAGLFSQKKNSAPPKHNLDLMPFKNIYEWVHQFHDWFGFSPKLAHAVALALIVVIIPLYFIVKEPALIIIPNMHPSPPSFPGGERAISTGSMIRANEPGETNHKTAAEVGAMIMANEPVPINIQISMMAEMHSTLSRSDRPSGVPTAVDKGASLSVNDCIQLHFKVSKDVYGYLLHQSTTGTINKYFEGKLIADHNYQFPEGETKACLTGKPGQESFYLVLSETVLTNFDEKISAINLSPTLKLNSDVLESIKHSFPKVTIESFYYFYE